MSVNENVVEKGDEFRKKVDEILNAMQDMSYADLVVGIPFYNEKDTIESILKTVDEGLEAFPNLKKLIVCIGDPAGSDALEIIRSTKLKTPNISFILDPGINGRGFSIMTILEIAKQLEADAIILKADMVSENGEGFSHSWIEQLIYPITQGYDTVFAKFKRHYFENTTGTLLVRPLLETIYGYNLYDPLAGLYGIAHDLVEDYCMEASHWLSYIGGYGIDPWLVTRAVVWDKKICEVNLGATLSPSSMQKILFLFKEITRSFWECIIADQDYWLNHNDILKFPDKLLRFTANEDVPKKAYYKFTDFVSIFKSDYEKYGLIYKKLLPKELASSAEEVYNLSYESFILDEELWATFTYRFLEAYCFSEEISKEDILSAFMVAYEGAVAGYIKQINNFKRRFDNANPEDIENLAYKKLIDFETSQTKAFLKLKISFTKNWVSKSEEKAPPIVPLDYLEFIPGVPIVLPKQLTSLNGQVVWTNGIFNEIKKKYTAAFYDFIYNKLHIPRDADSKEIVAGISELVAQLEKTANLLFAGDLHTLKGTKESVDKMFEMMPCGKVMAVKEEILEKLLCEFIPSNLLVAMGYTSIGELLDAVTPRKAMALAFISEERAYVDRINLWLEDNLRPDNMEEVEIERIVVGKNKFPNIASMSNISALNKITGVIIISTLAKGMGGRYPKLLYFTHIIKSAIEAEHYAYIWGLYARERRNFGIKVINSIIGHHGKDIFSAHNIFENWHQKEFVARLKILGKKLEDMGMKTEAEAIYLMAEGYNLSFTLEDGTFIPCSAWSWASYSFKGGKGVPAPLSIHVERNWFNNELLVELCKYMGYSEEEIMEVVFQLMGEGKESYDIANILLKIKPFNDAVVVQDIENWPPAGSLVRYEGNPILRPIHDHPWESKYVLNAAALKIENKVFILYRAFGDDNISRIGMAVSDGCNILERLPEPIFFPQTPQEKKGCEDPRTVIMGDKIYMFYTAYDGVVAQIAAACISITDFLKRDFSKWERLGLAFPNIWNKDAVIFPEKINDQYILYHRIEPSIWVSYSEELKFPWPKDGHKIIMGPRTGMMWDSMKIGAGAQPIKTKYGWLLIYHGVDDNLVYRLGAALVELDNPSRLLYRSPNPILSPQMHYEVGDKSTSWVPNVVFTCGAVPVSDREILEADDEILVYYGAADTYLCAAFGKIGDLIPYEIRQKTEKR
ncbi:hypothetical protein TSYNTROPHJE_20850 [Tepidanaerobacter syntrophicus]|uniref:glycoside hydrolase family 130 protein n=1 Tax=Tepidanaerobacter syntrophicus TaxID=224999 RepID=UPI0022ED9B5D|nr:glycosidase [Tepidanaerobacter syntrophicus]GLI20272.1 hypothetical protein TSYNTROPHJE_20850 [Tepidanaerobacter syntrophicus]